MDQPKNAYDVFNHPNNIAIGKGRVLWGPETVDMHGRLHTAGWVLPGGVRTLSRDLAETVARQIHLSSK